MKLVDRLAKYIESRRKLREAKRVVAEYERDPLIYNREHHGIINEHAIAREVVDAYWVVSCDRTLSKI